VNLVVAFTAGLVRATEVSKMGQNLQKSQDTTELVAWENPEKFQQT